MVAPGIVLFDDVDAEHWTKRIIRNSNREIITSQTGEAMRKVAFICVHNSCRSQIAEALESIYAEPILIFIPQVWKPSRRSIRMPYDS